MKRLYYLLLIIQCIYGPIHSMEPENQTYDIQESLRVHKKRAIDPVTPKPISQASQDTNYESGSQQATPHSSQSQPIEHHPYKEAFFNGKTIKTNLLKFIKAEKKRIDIAIYIFTDYEIAQALIDAHNRGVIIEIVADSSSQLTLEHTQLPRLAQAGINVYIWDPLKGLMHNKYIIFESTLNGQTLVWTGSYNFSKAASGTHQENVLVLEDAVIASRYEFIFGRLKAKSTRLKANPIPLKKL